MDDIGQDDGGCSASTCKISPNGTTCQPCHWKKGLIGLEGLANPGGHSQVGGRRLKGCKVSARWALNALLLCNLPSLALLMKNQKSDWTSGCNVIVPGKGSQKS